MQGEIKNIHTIRVLEPQEQELFKTALEFYLSSGAQSHFRSMAKSALEQNMHERLLWAPEVRD